MPGPDVIFCPHADHNRIWGVHAHGLDHYVAICYTLHYSTILTNPVITKAGLPTFLRRVMLVIPFTFLTKCLPYCQATSFSIPTVTTCVWPKCSCGKVKVNTIYGLLVSLPTWDFDIFVFFLSYTMILWAMVSLSYADVCYKDLSTRRCSLQSLKHVYISHMCYSYYIHSNLIHYFCSPFWGTKHFSSHLYHYC